MRILIVEDEPTLGKQLKATLEHNGYAVDLSTDGEDGHFLGSTEDYDAVILDLGLPEIDGLTVLGMWRKEGRKFPVLVLTARDSWSDKVAGLDAGADDYLQAVPDRGTDRPPARADPPRLGQFFFGTDRGRRAARYPFGPRHAERRTGEADGAGIQAAVLPAASQGQGRQPHRTDRAYLRSGFDRDSNTIEVFVTRIRKKLGPDVITTIRGWATASTIRRNRARLTAGLFRFSAGHDTGRADGQGTESVTTTAQEPKTAPHTGSLARRMMLIAFAWITVLLLGGGLALDRTLTGLVTRNFDEQLGYMLTAMVASAEIGPDGEVFFNRPLGDQRFLEPNSGLYWQISGQGHEDFPSRSLWDRTLKLQSDHVDTEPHIYDSGQFEGERLRMIERSVILPGSNTLWQFAVAASRSELDAQIRRIRSILIWSFVVLGLGLFMAALADLLRLAVAARAPGDRGHARRRGEPGQRAAAAGSAAAGAGAERAARTFGTAGGGSPHPCGQPGPCAQDAADGGDERGDGQGWTCRYGDPRGGGDAAPGRSPSGPRARVGRRATGLSRAVVWESAEAVERAVTRSIPKSASTWTAAARLVAIERQDLDEIGQPDRERGQVWRRQRVHHRGREPGGPEVLRHLGRG
jgi:CheY-like chemotaxis protein